MPSAPNAPRESVSARAVRVMNSRPRRNRSSAGPFSSRRQLCRANHPSASIAPMALGFPIRPDNLVADPENAAITNCPIPMVAITPAHTAHRLLRSLRS